jgi:hypothetical protein
MNFVSHWHLKGEAMTHPGMFSPSITTFSALYGRIVYFCDAVPLFAIWMLAVGAKVPARRKMVVPGIAASTACWIELKGEVKVPVPLLFPVGET